MRSTKARTRTRTRPINRKRRCSWNAKHNTNLTPRVGDGPRADGRYPSRDAIDLLAAVGKEPTGMSSANVLDSIIEGVRADVAARAAVVGISESKAAAGGTS